MFEGEIGSKTGWTDRGEGKEKNEGSFDIRQSAASSVRNVRQADVNISRGGLSI